MHSSEIRVKHYKLCHALFTAESDMENVNTQDEYPHANSQGDDPKGGKPSKTNHTRGIRLETGQRPYLG